jgi:DNA-binding transcriptional LysR family regulator
MNIEDVRAFVAVVDMGSVARAALRLNLTQPAISRRVQRLEQSLGVTLLDRDQKPARPTRAGEAAYRRCLDVVRATDTLTRETHSQLPAGPLRIGISLGIAESVFVPALDAIREKHPQLPLHLIGAGSIELRKQVAAGMLEAAIVMARPDRPLDDAGAEQLGIERVCVVAGKGLGLKSPAALADLGALPWVINPDGCGFRAQLDRAMADSGHALEIGAQTWGTALQLALIARGGGLGLVPERLTAESVHRPLLKIIEIRDFQSQLAVWMVRSVVLGPLTAAVDDIGATVRAILESKPRSGG